MIYSDFTIFSQYYTTIILLRVCLSHKNVSCEYGRGYNIKGFCTKQGMFHGITRLTNYRNDKGKNMIYQIRNEQPQEISFEQIDGKNETVCFMNLQEFEQYYAQLEFNVSCLEECRNVKPYRGSKIEVYDDFTYSYLRVLDTGTLRKLPDRMALFMKKNLLICVEIVDADKHLENKFRDILTGNIRHMTLEKILYNILIGFLGDINDTLFHVESHVLQLEERLFNGEETGDVNKEAFQIKRHLFTCQNYYEEIQDVCLALTANANHIFHQDSMRYLKILTEKTERICKNLDQLLERLIHLQEAYDAALDLNLNRIMKIFTVVTTVFLPLTLIAGWYGMNFNMPELEWKYGYSCVIGLSVLVIIVSMLFFKRKKWL